MNSPEEQYQFPVLGHNGRWPDGKWEGVGEDADKTRVLNFTLEQ